MFISPGTHTHSQIFTKYNLSVQTESCVVDRKTKQGHHIVSLPFFFNLVAWPVLHLGKGDQRGEMRKYKNNQKKKKTVGEILFSRHSHVSLFFTARIGNEGKIDPNNVQFRH